MLSGAVTNRYARGLFAAAQQAGVLDPVDDSMRALTRFSDADMRFRAVLEHPGISEGAKTQFVAAVMGERLHPLVGRALAILIRRRRTKYVDAVARAYHALANEARGIVAVEVESAREPGEGDVSELVTALSRITGRQVAPTVRVNPALIAGYRLRIGDRVVDGTLQGALRQFGEALRESPAVKEANR
jgi:F-type H+-transporting ATPase subunit delta